jgi:hypothetical protein
MRCISVTLGVLLVSLAVEARPREAQQKASWAELATMLKNRQVEVVQKDGSIQAGKLVAVTEGGIDILPEGMKTDSKPQRKSTIRRQDVLKLYVTKGGGMGRAAGVAGLSIGAAALGIFGTLGAALDANEAALAGFAGAAGCVTAAVLLSKKTGRKRTEILLDTQR